MNTHQDGSSKHLFQNAGVADANPLVSREGWDEERLRQRNSTPKDQPSFFFWHFRPEPWGRLISILTFIFFQMGWNSTTNYDFVELPMWGHGPWIRKLDLHKVLDGLKKFWETFTIFLSGPSWMMALGCQKKTPSLGVQTTLKVEDATFLVIQAVPFLGWWFVTLLNG